MDNRENIVKQFTKYCSQCDGQCCKRGVFTVFGKEAEALERNYPEFKKCNIFDQRGKAQDIYIGTQCVFNDGNGCKLPMNLRPTDCLSFPLYPKLKEIKGELKIDSFVIQKECPFSEEIAQDKNFLNAIQQLWENSARELTGKEIIDWLGVEGSWHDWYHNAIEVKCHHRFNLKLKDNKRYLHGVKPYSSRKTLVSFIKYFICLAPLMLSLGINAQGLTNSSGYITCSGSPYITVNNASLDNSGTYVKASETILFSGTIASDIKGNATDYHNIIVSNTGGITLNTSNLSTFDNLTVNSGAIFTLTPTGKLTVNTTLTNSAGTSGLVISSTTNGSGSLIHSTAGVSATVRHYLTDDVATYYYHTVAPPTSDATAAVFKIPNSGPYVYYYNPANTAGSRWTNIVTSATALTTGTGYLINFKTQTTAETLSYAGTLNTGSYSLPLVSSGDGYNLVGNPYPCAIDWNASSGWTLTNVDNVITVWVPAAGNYGSYVAGAGSGTNGVSNIIASGQGFFVHATGSNPALGIANGVKIHDNTKLKSGRIDPVRFKLRLTNNVNGFSDEAVVYYSPTATAKFDKGLEALKFFSLTSTSSQIYTQARDSGYLSINALPTDNKDSIPLFFKCGLDATYTIEVIENNSIDSLTLTDLLASKKHSLLKGGYTFSAHKIDTTRRFIINLSEKHTVATDIGTAVSDAPKILIFSNGKTVYIRNLSAQHMQGDLTITNMIGQIVTHDRINLENETTKYIQTSGIYVVSFGNKEAIIKRKLIIQ
jgi:Fe-S-cluster containining protein